MEWIPYVSYFFSGAFLINALPHVISGIMGRPFQAQCRFEWNLTSSTIMACAVSHQCLREPMFDVEPMH
jgi:hypothetical protein